MRRRRLCTSPTRNQCRRGTIRPGRNYHPDNLQCAGREMYQGPIRWSPIDEEIWYERAHGPERVER